MSGDFYDLFRPAEAERTPLSVVPTNGTATNYAAAALRREAESVASAPDGTRNDSLNRAWFNMGRHIGAGNIDVETVRATLRDAGRACGLAEDEVGLILRDGSTSAVEAGAQLPRHPAPLPDLPTPTILPHPPVEGEGSAVLDGQAEDDVASWAPLALDDVLDGSYEPELPTLLPRIDGAFLLYPARIHSLHGESESGKSLVAQAEAARLIRDAHDVLFIDFESDRSAVVGRLLELGATSQQIRAHFTYVRPEVDPRKFPHEREAIAALLGKPYALAVIDGVTEALGIFGASTKDNDDITAFMRLLPRTVARLTGAAVVLVDHVTKDSEGRGRFAIGGQAKMAALDGAAYVVEVVDALGRGRRGVVVLRVAKDRPGGVRARAGEFRKTDRTQEAARIVIDSTEGHPGPAIRVEVRQPTEAGAEFRPTHLMQKVSELLEGSHEPMSQRTIAAAVGGRAEVARAAVALLVRDHYVKAEHGPRNSTLHSSIQPYREGSDPASDKYVSTLSQPVDNPSGSSASECVPSASGTHSDPVRPSPYVVGLGLDALDTPSDEVSASRRDALPERAADGDELVACSSCYRPTTRAVADRFAGRCATCHRNTGGETA